MDIEKIEKFIDAGYTKEEINKLLEGGKPEGVQAENKQPAGGAEPKEPKEQGAADQTHDSAVTVEMLQTLTSTVEGLKETVKALQQANAKTADSKGAKPQDETRAIIDSFINTL